MFSKLASLNPDTMAKLNQALQDFHQDEAGGKTALLSHRNGLRATQNLWKINAAR